ncbi:efflux RND transporter permease subunit [Dickeya chrysanthemi]|uniref:efflux RND transporter permease subunit n=1 Tax=Dickeya chrysanthemi TaxID=556 RepID=UPI0025A13D20|nr:efflux RND transporter permease subunit [Dickeya chrysanthemi]WJM85526.1 efflux RND transporter permease subunit [Dickeya chrysanthemi]
MGAATPLVRDDRYGTTPPSDALQSYRSVEQLASGELAPLALVEGWKAQLPRRGIDDGNVIDWLLWWDNILLTALRPLTLVLTAALIALGVWSYRHLSIDATPDITNVQVQINTQAPGYSPLEAEQRVTFAIETAMAGLPKLDYSRSLSRYGLSQVTVVFKDAFSSANTSMATRSVTVAVSKKTAKRSRCWNCRSIQRWR